MTTGTSVIPSLSFTPVTNAPANTSVSGMPYFVTSNAIAVTTASTISVAGGITPQYQVSSNSGVSWSTASNTTPATVAAGDLVRVLVVPATTPFTTSVTNLILGSTVASFSVTTGYANPPSWMPMAMLNVAFNTTTKTLSVQDLNTHPSFPGTTLPALTYVPAGTYDPTKPWSAINGGVTISRQLGWDDSTALHGAGITVPGSILYNVQAAYPGGNIWIELISKSPGLETYFADGMFGVGGTGSGTSGSPQPYSNPATGLPIIYAPNYYGIFGTNGSSTKWKWDGTMIHNVYAVPAAFITQPNQVFTATYRVYIGDALGNDIAPAAATTEVWSWKGPATVPPQVAAPMLMTPVDAIGNTPMPTYTWSAITGATSYNFYLKNTANTALLNVPAVTADCTTVPGVCSYTPAKSLSTGSYIWYAQAVTGNGISQWGTGKAFNVKLTVKPVAVILGAPTGAIANTPLPTYTWTQDASATSYNFYLKDSGNNALLNVSAIAATCAAGSCSYTPSKTLISDSYTWYVQAVNSAGIGPWGTGQNFSVVIPPPPVTPGLVILGTPSGAIANTPLPTYTWTQDATATSYNFYLKDSGNNALLNVPAIAATCAAGSCSYTPSKTLISDSYTWYVQAVNSAGIGPWGTGQNFSVVIPPPPVKPGLVTQNSPSGSVVTGLPTYTWTVEPNATSYNFYLKNSANAALLNTPAITADCTTVPGICSVTPNKTVPAGDSYIWYVQAVNSAGIGPWGTGMGFSRP